MRFRLAFLFCASCLPLSHALPQEVLTVPLVDKTGSDSPLEVSGRVLLRETARANELEWSWQDKVAIKNVSSKPILLFVATFTEIGRHPAPAGRHSAPGNGPTYEFDNDRFFSETLVQPGEVLALRDTTPGTPNIACCINPLAEVRDPSAEYRLHFVQFADGSSFGDPAEAQDALALRQTIMKGLRELIQSYVELGASGFSAKLKEPSTFSTTGVHGQILARYQDGGVPAALGDAQRMLATAERHAAMIASTGTGPTSSPPE
jgi:hypothetical protein